MQGGGSWEVKRQLHKWVWGRRGGLISHISGKSYGGGKGGVRALEAQWADSGGQAQIKEFSELASYNPK